MQNVKINLALKQNKNQKLIPWGWGDGSVVREHLVLLAALQRTQVQFSAGSS